MSRRIEKEKAQRERRRLEQKKFRRFLLVGSVLIVGALGFLAYLANNNATIAAKNLELERQKSELEQQKRRLNEALKNVRKQVYLNDSTKFAGIKENIDVFLASDDEDLAREAYSEMIIIANRYHDTLPLKSVLEELQQRIR